MDNNQKTAREFVSKALHNLCEEPVDSDYGNMVTEAVAVEAARLALSATPPTPVVAEGHPERYLKERFKMQVARALVSTKQVVGNETAYILQDALARYASALDTIRAAANAWDETMKHEVDSILRSCGLDYLAPVSATPPPVTSRGEEEPDYSDPQVQKRLALEAERRLRLCGLLGNGDCEKVRQRIERKYPTTTEKGTPSC